MGFGDKFKGFWSDGPRWRVWLKRIVFVLIAWPLVMTLVYAIVPVPISNVMVLRLFTGNGLHRQWMRLDAMSPELPRAVIACGRLARPALSPSVTMTSLAGSSVTPKRRC